MVTEALARWPAWMGTPRPPSRRDRRRRAGQIKREAAQAARLRAEAAPHRRRIGALLFTREAHNEPNGGDGRVAAAIAPRSVRSSRAGLRPTSRVADETRGERRGGRPRWARALVMAAAVSVGAGTFAVPDDASAQNRRRARLKSSDLQLKGSVAARPLVLLGALAILTLLPFVIIMVTSFVKISVVLSIVRSAIGTQQIPPTQVITGLSIVLTVYIMAPVGLEIYKATEKIVQQKRPGTSLVSAQTVDLLFDAIGEAAPPLRTFLKKNSHDKDQAMFFSMAKRLRRPEDRAGVGPEDFMILIPSFVISELKEAFQIGFIIFVPFLVIDMVVSNILMALGMQMLSPTTISLPFKLLLFVMIDGWYLITKGLITGYI